MAARKILWEEHTWPELREAAAENRVVVIPVGTIEQHGPHLPLSTDCITSREISRLVVEQVPEEALLMPQVYYSFNFHHLDFPGTVAVDGHTIIDYVTDIGKSVAHHGFRKILLVNGHGSNVPFLDIAARNICNHTEAVAAMVSWWSLADPALSEVREAEHPGGLAHGCELETSVILHFRPDLVQLDKAERDISYPRSEFFYWDLQKPSPVYFQEFFSRNSRTGTQGDPMTASAEKGRKVVECVVGNMVRLLRDFRARPIAPRVDHH
ncbi:MAG TPA: creatininase family protein [Armatimonadota bacterium]|nr:creatininase family protein [Armatimonadota bacterium]